MKSPSSCQRTAIGPAPGTERWELQDLKVPQQAKGKTLRHEEKHVEATLCYAAKKTRINRLSTENVDLTVTEILTKSACDVLMSRAA